MSRATACRSLVVRCKEVVSIMMLLLRISRHDSSSESMHPHLSTPLVDLNWNSARVRGPAMTLFQRFRKSVSRNNQVTFNYDG